MIDLRDLIAAKRDGAELTSDQIATFVSAAAGKTAPEAQLASMLMVIFCRGMNDRERTDYALAMMNSGETLNWDHLDRPTLDKHSTGGVGDKISLIWGPLVTAVGYAVPMISGRGLGHTGGTLDKLDTIPGFRTDLSSEEMDTVVREVGCVITGQTADLVPADRTLYDLRSRTATVPTLDHIAPSILSKKLAEGAGTLVLDVKCGTGAFMKDIDSARELGKTMLAIGRGAGRNMAALITNMDAPLGMAIGNAVEVQESVAVLSGAPGELRELTIALAEAAITASGGDVDRATLERALNSGAAREVFEKMVAAQGGDPSTLQRGLHGLKDVKQHLVEAPRAGWIIGIDALGAGLAVAELGGGRGGDGQAPHPGVGAWLQSTVGMRVEKGQPWMRLMHAEVGLEAAVARAEAALTLSDEAPAKAGIVLETL